MDIVIEINGERYKHVPLKDNPYCTSCELAVYCKDVSWIKSACYYQDEIEGIGKFKRLEK